MSLVQSVQFCLVFDHFGFKCAVGVIPLMLWFLQTNRNWVRTHVVVATGLFVPAGCAGMLIIMGFMYGLAALHSHLYAGSLSQLATAAFSLTFAAKVRVDRVVVLR